MMAKASPSPILQLIRRVVEDQSVQTASDHELLRRFIDQRDEAAFHILLRRHGPMVLDVCRGVSGNEADAEDAFQATFLILARKAGSIRKAASVGSWLHGIAYRTALKARAQSATRRNKEARAPARDISDPDELTWREVRQVLHEELTELAERYRVPLVACYLEGKTQDEAAAQLGLATSTLKERLERGRSLLRARLVRRGLGPAGVLVATAWPASSASACIPSTLVASTIKAATLVAAGQAATTVVSANVAALTEGVLKTMLLTKLKIATAVVVMIAMVGMAAWGVGSVAATAKSPEAKLANTPPETADAPPGKKDAEEKPEKEKKVLTPEEAIKQRPKEKVTVEFKVSSALMQENPAFVPKGEEVDYITFTYNDRFYFKLYGKAVTHIKRLGIEPSVYFRDKVVRVTGKVVARGDGASMLVEGLDQLEVVK